MENGNLTSSRLELYNVDTELALIVGKRISYQAGSQGFKFHLPPEENKAALHKGTYFPPSLPPCLPACLPPSHTTVTTCHPLLWFRPAP